MLEQEIGCSIRVRAEGGGELRCTRGNIRSAGKSNRSFAFDPGVDRGIRALEVMVLPWIRHMKREMENEGGAGRGKNGML